MALLSHRRLAASLLVLAAAVAFPARAGVPLRDTAGTPVRWNLEIEQPNVVGGRITYYVDPLTSVEELPGDDTERVAAMAAAESWGEFEGSRIHFLEAPSRVAYARNGSDRVNYLAWKQFALSPFTLAATYTTSTDGVITDADIIFNDTVQFVKWATATPGLAGFADVQAVATHELGHLLGLDHSPVTASTMGWIQPVGAISSRSLSPDDTGSVLEAYPNISEPNLGSIIGKVRIGSRLAGKGLPVFALDARSGEARGSAFTGADGIYRIHGLPPGPYRVAAAPLASVVPFSKWWADSPTRFRAAFLGEGGPDGVTEPRTVFVRPGFPETGVHLRVQRYGRRSFGESGDGPAAARDLRPGEAATGAFEGPLDEDWFRVTPHGGDLFDVRVRASGLGADADPEVAVLDSDGTTVLASSLDLRPPVDEAFFHGPAGVDRDAVLLEFAPPGPGDLFVRVRAQPQSQTGGPASFYLLEVVPSAGVPDPGLSLASVAPPAARVGGGPVPVLSVRPRDWLGDSIGSGATVTALRSDGGAPLTLADLGTGSFAAEVPALLSPGEVRFSITVSSDRGSASLPDAAVLVVAGPRDAVRSTFVASPRRVEAGGAVPVSLVYTPRDAANRLLGPGLPVEILFEGPPAGTLGPVEDHGDGTYEATLLPASLPSSARVSVRVGGLATGVSRLVGFGWDLALVAVDLGAVVVEAQGKPGVSRREWTEFGRAGASLDALLAGIAAGDEQAAAAAAARAVAVIARAGRGPRFPDGRAAAVELAEALRRRCHGFIDAVVFPEPDAEGQALLAAAQATLAAGDAKLLAGDPTRAARLYVSAMRRAEPLL